MLDDSSAIKVFFNSIADRHPDKARRDVEFLAVEWSQRTQTYLIRLELKLDGRDDMNKRNFDYWFEWLKEADDQQITIAFGVGIGLYTERYDGRLCKTGDLAPKVCPDNPNLFEFSICEVETAKTFNSISREERRRERTAVQVS